MKRRSQSRRQLAITGIVKGAESVAVVTLSPLGDGSLPSWEPGAHIDVVLESGLERQYSLCGDPDDTSTWRIAVLNEPSSRGGSRYIHENLRVGDVIEVVGPRNNFALKPATSYLFIAGGIGITPLLPMIRQVNRVSKNWRLVYGGRQMASMAFVEELTEYGGNVVFWPRDKMGDIDLGEVLAEAPRDVELYCCGPEGLIQAVSAMTASRSPGTRVHIERFKPRSDHPAGGGAFEVHLAFTGISIAVGEDQTILDALEAAGVSVASSCREGTCGSCETTVIEGVPDHRDSYLSEESRRDGDSIMVCCSRATSSRLVLDL